MKCTCKAEHWQPHAESCPARRATVTNTLTPEEIADLNEDSQCSCKELDQLRGCLAEALGNVTARNQQIERLQAEVRNLHATIGEIDRQHAASAHTPEPLPVDLDAARYRFIREQMTAKGEISYYSMPHSLMFLRGVTGPKAFDQEVDARMNGAAFEEPSEKSGEQHGS